MRNENRHDEAFFTIKSIIDPMRSTMYNNICACTVEDSLPQGRPGIRVNEIKGQLHELQGGVGAHYQILDQTSKLL